MAVDIGIATTYAKFFIFIIIGVVILAFGFLGYYMWRAKTRYKFMVLSRDGLRMDVVTANVKVDPMNRKHKMFIFSTNDSILPIRPPNLYIDNKPYRVITFNSEGDYCYCDTAKLDETKIKFALEPEEKQVSLYRIKEATHKYDTAFTKMELAKLVGLALMVIIVVIGNIYLFMQSAKMLKTVGSLQTTGKEIASMQLSVAQAQQSTMEQMIYLQYYLRNESYTGNYTRTLS